MVRRRWWVIAIPTLLPIVGLAVPVDELVNETEEQRCLSASADFDGWYEGVATHASCRTTADCMLIAYTDPLGGCCETGSVAVSRIDHGWWTRLEARWRLFRRVRACVRSDITCDCRPQKPVVACRAQRCEVR
jgi:hypothetical protein